MLYVCVLYGQLSQAQDAVTQELHRLDLATEHCLEQVNRTFQDITALLEHRRQEMVAAVGTACEEKRKVLEEQLALIEGEKNKVSYENLISFCLLDQSHAII
jgi:tripartite motif-containing protein 2/3